MNHTADRAPTVMQATTRAEMKEGVDEAWVFLPVADILMQSSVDY